MSLFKAALNASDHRPYRGGGKVPGPLRQRGATGAIYERRMKYAFGLLSSIEKLSHTMMDWIAGPGAGYLKKPLLAETG